MAYDEKTTFLGLPLPHPRNTLREDCPRIRESLQGLDGFAKKTDASLSRLLETDTALAKAVQDQGEDLTEAISRESEARSQADSGHDDAIAALERELANLRDERLSDIDNRFSENGKIKAENLPLTDAVNSATGTLAASDTAVKTAYDKAVAATNMAATCMHNTRLVLTESDAAWTSPVTGWARVTVIGGGGGGAGGYGDGGGTASSGSGGDSGEYAIHFVQLQKDSSYAVVIGAGGVAGTSGVANTETNRGGNGGQSSFHSLTASGGIGGIRGIRSSDMLPAGGMTTFLGQSGGVNSYPSAYNVLAVGGSGGGAGYGRGGNGASVGLKNTVTAPATPGTQGAVIIEYYDKEDA